MTVIRVNNKTNDSLQCTNSLLRPLSAGAMRLHGATGKGLQDGSG